MNRKLGLSRWWVICFILSAMLLTGCNLGDDLPVCDPADLSLQASYPNYRTIVEDLSSPMITWDYRMEADGTSPACNPQRQHIRFGLRSFDENGAEVLTVLVERDLLGTDRNYTPGLALESAQHYFWEVTWFGDPGTLPVSRLIAFNTGPVCERDSLLPPVILSVPDGAVITSDATISWEFQGGCTPEAVEVDVSSSPAFGRSSTEVYYFGMAFHGLYGHEACREYYWRVASVMIVPPTEILFFPDVELPWPLAVDPPDFTFSGYIQSEFTPIRSFYVIGDACPIPPPGFGSLDFLPIPRIRVEETANCRSGPSLDFPLLDVLPQGEEYEIQAGNTPGDAWMVFDPAINANCWVHADLVEVLGDTRLVEIIDPLPTGHLPPTETVAPFNCAQYNNDFQACNAEAACRWDPNGSPNSPCVNR